ncbi:hypothetical protein [Coprobacter fastidiosus]|jgi:hypothetical protein|uniref:hypothetical protein n=2 Tax=Coprobacter fastidiosus TaxID=1099853 RepID=UPI002675E9C2|nr:hypothetical protein [Coprobacter fastidiosus]
MKRILITLSALLLISTAGYAQKNIFEKMPPNQRDSILIETATKALLKYAPDYYREYKKPEIILKKTFPNKSSGRLFYEVTFLYDPQKEKYLFDYIAKVYIWADNGKAFIIKFMNEWRLHIEELEKKGDSTIMPFFVPRVGKGTPLPVDSSKNVPRKFKVYK